MVKVHRPKFSGKKQLNCLRKVRPVNKGLRVTMYVALPPTQRRHFTMVVVSVFADTSTRLPYQPIGRISHLRRRNPSNPCALATS